MLRRGLAGLAAVALVATVGWFWFDSLVPETYSVMDMGSGHGHEMVGSGTGTSVDQLTGPQEGTPDVALTVTARRERIDVGDRSVDGYTLNGTSPGPVVRAVEGDLVEVVLVNDNVADGVTLHWHGLDVPNAEDGVAGVTQNAVAPGEQHRYRFLAEDPGTYWYHSHQVSHEQVRGGLWGSLVIEPADGVAGTEVLAAYHSYDSIRTINGRTGQQVVRAEPGSTVRVRVTNTDNGPLRTWVDGAAYRILAVDARDLNRPPEIRGRYAVVAAGGRLDLEVVTPASGRPVVVTLGNRTSAVLIGPSGTTAGSGPLPDEAVDLLSYGEPAGLGFDPRRPDRDYDYDIGRRLGFLDGRPGMWWTVNGKMYPDVPMYLVSEGDVVRMTIRNDSGDVHPMHLHGHHVVVLSRNGVAATGSPWWVDSLDVQDGETFEVAFVADNPGVWMDHCHNLPHAVEGLVAHLMYTGVTTPYVVGGEAGNQPE